MMPSHTVDDALVRLTKDTQAKLGRLGAESARESAFMVAKEEFTDAAVGILERALFDMTPEQKVAAFEKIAKGQIASRVEELTGLLAGNHHRNEDADHYLQEEITKAVFGGKCYDAFNEFEGIFGAKPKSKG